jgi:hypothetical protein
MNIGTTFIADLQTAEAMEPGNRTFDDPAPASKSFSRFDAFSGKARRDALFSQPRTMGAGIIGLVGMQLSWPFARLTRQAGDCRNGLDHRHEHARIMDLGARYLACQRQSSTVDDEMMLATEFAAIGRIGAGFPAPEGGKARWQSQYWRAPTRFGRIRVTDAAWRHGYVARCRLAASRANDASMSCRYRSQVHAAGIPTACLS